MALTSVPGLAPARGQNAAPAQAGPRPSHRLRAAWRRHRARTANAAAVRDIFMDVIVLLSVLNFIAIVVGIGLLAMGSSAPWPR
ncbi:hypothetical protein M6D93_19245 [Jatrophihabitans telluris]|uniref:Uncharacterized protein n=1 Tax=Jatrophihabitans telluris TaxID=2038343 RepID=A0ABY4QYK6_9ACTN|nr:hypothetical protein [Jatrophihabitans telluris]UQX88393.1 hypothetical protein M6D93_19245 [Jatrophihabitans telluris]